MSDLISRQDAIEAHCNLCLDKYECHHREYGFAESCPDIEVFNLIPSVETEERTEESAQNVPSDELISRKAAIKAIDDLPSCYNGYSDTYDKAYIIGVLEELPSAQPEYYDYSDIDSVWNYYAEENDINLTDGAKQLKDAMWVGYRKGKESAQPETAERTAAVDVLRNELKCVLRKDCERTVCKTCDLVMKEADIVDALTMAIDALSAQPDLSAYSDKLWKAAYERGKKEAMESIVQCKGCEWWSQGFPYDYCDKHQIASDGYCFCSWSAERREE